MRVEKRLALLEANRKEDATGYRLPDGTIKYIRDKSLPTVLHDIAEGRDTPGARLLLNAEACVTAGGGRLHELAQALRGAGPSLEPDAA